MRWKMFVSKCLSCGTCQIPIYLSRLVMFVRQCASIFKVSVMNKLSTCLITQQQQFKCLNVLNPYPQTTHIPDFPDHLHLLSPATAWQIWWIHNWLTEQAISQGIKVASSQATKPVTTPNEKHHGTLKAVLPVIPLYELPPVCCC